LIVVLFVAVAKFLPRVVGLTKLTGKRHSCLAVNVANHAGDVTQMILGSLLF